MQLTTLTLDASIDATDVNWRDIRDDLVRAYADHGVPSGPYVTRLLLAQTCQDFRARCRINAANMHVADK